MCQGLSPAGRDSLRAHGIDGPRASLHLPGVRPALAHNCITHEQPEGGSLVVAPILRH